MNFEATPEPSALGALFGLGGTGIVGLVWRRRRRS
ncbi:MAG: PEP-CTERM sorting domain-containing protein [Thermoguttaceae bacterium]